MGTSWTIQAITITYHCFLLASKLRDNQLGGPCGIFWYYSANPGSARLYNNIKTCQRRSCLLDIVQKNKNKKGSVRFMYFASTRWLTRWLNALLGFCFLVLNSTFKRSHPIIQGNYCLFFFFFFFGQRIEKNQHVAGAGLAAQPYSTGIWFKMFPKP